MSDAVLGRLERIWFDVSTKSGVLVLLGTDSESCKPVNRGLLLSCLSFLNLAKESDEIVADLVRTRIDRSTSLVGGGKSDRCPRKLPGKPKE